MLLEEHASFSTTSKWTCSNKSLFHKGHTLESACLRNITFHIYMFLVSCVMCIWARQLDLVTLIIIFSVVHNLLSVVHPITQSLVNGIHWLYWTTYNTHQFLGSFWFIIVGQDPSDSKSNRLHVDIFQFCLIHLRYIYRFLLNDG